MNPDDKDLRNLIDRHLPSPSSQETEVDCDRVLDQLRSSPAHLQQSRIADSDHASFRAWRRFAMIPTAAAVILAVFIAITWRQDAFAVVESVDGTLSRVVDGKAIQVGERIDPGTSVRSDGGAGAVLKLSDGARVEMHGQSELSLEKAKDGTRIRLNTGSVSVTPSNEPAGNLYVQNREVTVPVVGALFQSAGAAISPAGQTPAESGPRFEVASVRPSSPVAPGAGQRGGTGPGGCSGTMPQIDPRRFAVSNVTLYTLITRAYSTQWAEGISSDCLRANALDLVTGGPAWTRTDLFDIQAVIPEGFPAYTLEQFRNGDAPKLQKMLQHLLEDRFKLVMRRDVKEMQIYELKAGKDGAKRATIDGQDWIGTNTLWEKLILADPASTGTMSGIVRDPLTGATSQMIAARRTSMADLASTLALAVRRPVVERTGLAGQFNFDLDGFAPPNYTGVTVGLTIFAALEEQLGLRLESSKAPIPVWIIDHAEKPSEN